MNQALDPVADLATQLVDTAHAGLEKEITGLCEPVVRELLAWVPPELDNLINFSRVPLDLLRGGQRRTAPTPAEAQAALRRGWTIQLQNAERYSRRLAELCARMSLDLALSQVRINVYATPTEGDAAFETHHDVLDALIVQVRGHKHWRVWDASTANPVWVMSRELHHNPPASQLPIVDVSLGPGDVLLVRRGDPHQVTPAPELSQDELSVHLTVGIYAPTAHDLVRFVADEMGNDERFRVSLPMTRDESQQISWIEKVRQAAIDWWSSTPAPSLFSIMQTMRATGELPRSATITQALEIGDVPPDAPWRSVNPLTAIFYSGPDRLLLVNGRRISPVEPRLAEAVIEMVKSEFSGFTGRSLAHKAGVDIERAVNMLRVLAELGVAEPHPPEPTDR